MHFRNLPTSESVSAAFAAVGLVVSRPDADSDAPERYRPMYRLLAHKDDYLRAAGFSSRQIADFRQTRCKIFMQYLPSLRHTVRSLDRMRAEHGSAPLSEILAQSLAMDWKVFKLAVYCAQYFVGFPEVQRKVANILDGMLQMPSCAAANVISISRAS